MIEKKNIQRFLCRILLCCLLVTSVGVSAQSISPQQLEQLQKLTPEQRTQLLRVLGGGEMGGSTTTTAEPMQQVIEPLPIEQEQETVDLRFASNQQLIVELTQLDEDDDISLQGVRNALGKKVYSLDEQGYLQIEGIPKILIAGLSVSETQLRLAAEPALRELSIQVYRLPVIPQGSIALERFGTDLFKGAPSTFAPSGNIPVPLDYTVGPGDTLSLLLFGQMNADYRLAVGRDGTINIPEIGPVAIAGMNFEQVRENLSRRIKERYIGVDLSVTMGQLRSVQVFVLGDVNRPGSYTVSSLSNMTNALFVSGGVAPTGSMRDIRLKRRDRTVGRLDLYDLLLNGNTSGDLKIRTGDVIYVPPVGDQVAVFGLVTRPAIYELGANRSLSDVVKMAGGLLPAADKRSAKIERFDGDDKTLLMADLNSQVRVQIQNGDQIELMGAAMASPLRNAIKVSGHIQRERIFQWRDGSRLLNVLPNPEVFRQGADQQYVLIRRSDRKTGLISLLSSNWRTAYNNPGSSENIALKPQDEVMVFGLGTDRAAKIAPLIDQLEGEANREFPAKSVQVLGRVRAPGEYPYEAEMRISDLLRASGSVLENAYLDEAELTRLSETSGNVRTIHRKVNLENFVTGSDNDLVLLPNDVFTVKEIPLWREHRRVKVSGEIEFPGEYSASRGERLSSVIKRAGGLTSMAFPGGSVFVRKDLKQREAKQLRDLQRRLQTEIQALSDTQMESRQRGEVLLDNLSSTEALGRLVIDLNLALSGDLDNDVVLEDGDHLIIPPLSQEVTVIGEVQYPTSHIFQRGLDHLSYINKSGGSTANSDFGRIYVIRAGGNVVAQGNSNWFKRPGRAISIHPGDTIVVPFDSDQVSGLTLWTSVSQIVYNIAVSAAAVAAF